MFETALIAPIVALAATAIAGAIDIRTGHIPNWLSFTTLFAGLFLGAFLGGVDGLLGSLFGMLLCGLVPFLMWRRGAIGGGDVKMLAALGAVLGIFSGIEAQLLSFIAGAVFAMGRLAWQGRLLPTLGNAARTALNPFLPERLRREIKPELMHEVRLGGAIFVGTCLAVANLFPGTSWL